MNKDFDSWNELKKHTHSKDVNVFCNTREIWWASIGLNIGSEEDGKNNLFERPVLIVKVFNRGMLRILPLTGKIKSDEHHIPIFYGTTKSSLILSQLKTISSKRLSRKMDRLDVTQFDKVVNILKRTLI